MDDANAWRTASSSRGKAPRRPQKNATDLRQNGVTYNNGSTSSMGKSIFKDGGSASSYAGANSILKNGDSQRNSTTYRAQKPSQSSFQNGYSGGDPRKSFEKEIKLLLKHEATVERARWLFKEEITKSEDRLKRAFKELRLFLDERETKLLSDLDATKVEGLRFLDAKEQNGKELKVQTDRVTKMNDKELSELRQNVKKLANDERRVEDLGRNLRFQYEPDKLLDMIQTFGDVLPINEVPAKSSSLNSLISADSADASVASSDFGKSVNQVNIGGLFIQSDSMDATQLADLTRQLQESLKMQGIADDIIPEVSGSSGSMPQRRRPPPSPANGKASGNGANNKRPARAR